MPPKALVNNTTSDEIKQRIHGFVVFLHFVCNSDTLSYSPELYQFLSNDSKIFALRQKVNNNTFFIINLEIRKESSYKEASH